MAGGSVRYVTGGTTQMPRPIRYSGARWERSVATKAAYFSQLGLGSTTRVAVCHPFAPWSIGQIFTEGAVRSGAEVFPLGLALAEDALCRFLVDFRPTHICASPRNLVRIGHLYADRPDGGIVAIASGERLTDLVRAQVSNIWGGQVFDVYGMAEFDMLAGELPGSTGLALVQQLDFQIQDKSGESQPLFPGARGLLMVRDDPEAPFQSTGDKVAVVDAGDLWCSGRQSYAISIFGREDGAIFFMDGSMLNPLHVSSCVEGLSGIDELQVVVQRQPSGDLVEILFVASGTEAPEPEAVVEALLTSALDVADAYRLNAIRRITARQAAAGELQRTARGKVPPITVIDNA